MRQRILLQGAQEAFDYLCDNKHRWHGEYPVAICGIAIQTCCFRWHSAERHGVQYKSTKKSWMIRALFHEWGDELNKGMKKEGCQVLLLLDNASAHPVELPLSNVDIGMLPQITPSFLHSMYAASTRL